MDKAEPLKTMRSSNFELLRIISMIFVLSVHANFFSLGRPNNDFLNPLNLPDFLRVFIQSIFIVCVNCFVFISGWFKIKNGIKGICNIIFQYLWYALAIALVYSIVVRDEVASILKNSIKPDDVHWFVFSYLMLLIVSPVLNAFLDNSSKKEQITVLLLAFISQTLIGWFTDYIGIRNGLSVLYFIILYILANFIRKYGKEIKIFSYSKYVDISIFIIFALVNTVWSSFGNYTFLLGKGALFAYNAPLVILSTIYLCLFFSKLSFRSSLINKLARGGFSVYLLHVNPLVLSTIYVPFWDELWRSSHVTFWALLPVIVVTIYVVVSILDIIRQHVWNRILKTMKV